MFKSKIKKRGIKIANQQLVSYIRQNKDNYSVDVLKNYLVQQGYSQKDIDDAMAEAMGTAKQSPPPISYSSTYTPPVDTTQAAVAYILIWLTGLIIYLTASKDDKFTRFHAMQSIFLGIAMTVVYMVLRIVLFSSFFFVFFGGFLLVPLIWLSGIVIIVIMAVSAYQGKMTKLPLIGNFAQSVVEKN